MHWSWWIRSLVAIVSVFGLLFLNRLTTNPNARAEVGQAVPMPQAWVPFVNTGNSNPGTIYVPDNYTVYRDVYGTLHVVGEKVNDTTDRNVANTWVAVLDQAGNQIGSLSDSAPELGRPGSRTCFHAWGSSKFGEAGYRFTFDSTSTTDTPAPLKLTALNVKGSYNPARQWFSLTGEVRNDEPRMVYGVEAYGTLYSRHSKVIGCTVTRVKGIAIAAGKSASFELLFGSDNEVLDISAGSGWRVGIVGL